MIKTNVRSQLSLKTNRQIGLLNNSFIDNLFLANRFKNYILAFINFIHPINNKITGSQDNQNCFQKQIFNINQLNINQIKNTYYYKIYNNSLGLLRKNNHQISNKYIGYTLNYYNKNIYKYIVDHVKNLDPKALTDSVVSESFNSVIINILKSKINQGLNCLISSDKFNFFNFSLANNFQETKLINSLVNDVAVEQKYMEEKYEQSLLEVLNKTDITDVKRYICKIFNVISNQVKLKIKNTKMFSCFQIRNLERTLNNLKITQQISVLFENSLNKISNVIDFKDVKFLFENLSNMVMFNVKNLGDIRVSRDMVRKVVSYLCNQYDDYIRYNHFEQKKEYTHLRLNLINNTKRVFCEEFYNNFIDIYFKKQRRNLSVTEKIFARKVIQDVIVEQLNVYKDIKNKFNLSDIIDKSVNTLVEKNSHYNLFKDIKLDSNSLVFVKNKILNQIKSDKDVVNLFNKVRTTHDKKVYKDQVYNFVQSHLDKYIIENDKEREIVKIIHDVLKKEIYYLSDFSFKEGLLKSQFSDFTNNVNIYKIVNNYISRLRHNESCFQEFFQRNERMSVVYKIRNVDTEDGPQIVYHKDLKNFYKNHVSNRFEEHVMTRNGPKVVYHKDFKGFEDGVPNSVSVKLKNGFDGFESLKMIHKKTGEKQDNVSKVSTISKLTGDSGQVFDLRSDLNDKYIVDNSGKYDYDVRLRNKVGVSNEQVNKRYHKLIEETVKEKMEENIFELANKVYNNIEKRLKLEQRRAGLL